MDSVSVPVFGSNLDSLFLSLSAMKCSFSCAACVCIINKNHFKFEITIKNGNDKVSSVGKYGDQEAAVTQNNEDCSTATMPSKHHQPTRGVLFQGLPYVHMLSSLCYTHTYDSETYNRQSKSLGEHFGRLE